MVNLEPFNRYLYPGEKREALQLLKALRIRNKKLSTIAKKLGYNETTLHCWLQGRGPMLGGLECLRDLARKEVSQKHLLRIENNKNKPTIKER